MLHRQAQEVNVGELAPTDAEREELGIAEGHVVRPEAMLAAFAKGLETLSELRRPPPGSPKLTLDLVNRLRDEP